MAVGSSRRWQDAAPSFMSVRIVLSEKVDLSRGEASMGFPIEGTEGGNSTPIMGLPLNATEVSSSHTTTLSNHLLVEVIASPCSSGTRATEASHVEESSSQTTLLSSDKAMSKSCKPRRWITESHLQRRDRPLLPNLV